MGALSRGGETKGSPAGATAAESHGLGSCGVAEGSASLTDSPSGPPSAAPVGPALTEPDPSTGRSLRWAGRILPTSEGRRGIRRSFRRATLRLDLDDSALEALAERISERLTPPLTSSPWMDFEALVEYTSIAPGTLRKLTASGRIPGHGGKSKIYHRDEVDAALRGHSNRGRRLRGLR